MMEDIGMAHEAEERPRPIVTVDVEIGREWVRISGQNEHAVMHAASVLMDAVAPNGPFEIEVEPEVA